jgi:hypothetical protein
MFAAAWIDDGDLIRLTVAPQPRGGWDWRVWHTVRGHEYRFGVSTTSADAIDAAERAAMSLVFEDPRANAWPLLSQEPPKATADRAVDDSRVQSQPFSARLAGRVLAAIHTACDNADSEVALALLRVVNHMATNRSMQAATRRRSMEQIVAAHVRHWHLQNNTDPEE